MELSTSRKLLCAGIVFWLAVGPAAAAGQSLFAAPPAEPRQTRDRLSQERMDALVSGPMSVVRSRGLVAGRAAFERQLARTRAAHGARSIEVADLIESFGVALYTLGLGSDDRLREASIPYLEAAIPAYRAAFGAAHPEVAVALNSYADVLSELHQDDPPQSADTALDEAYRIRLSALGPADPETRANLRYLARLRGLPSRTRGDHARIEAVAALYRQLIANSPDDAQPPYLSAPYGRTALARMYARNGMAVEAREQLRLAIQQAKDWEEMDRCIFAATETADIEEILAGRAGSRESPFRMEAFDHCLLPPARTPESNRDKRRATDGF